MDGLHSETSTSAPVEELCERVRIGDQDAESRLVERLKPGLTLILHRATRGDVSLVEELCQDALIIVLQRLRTSGLQDPSGVAAFAAQTARNLAFANRRKTGRRRTTADPDAIDMTPDPGVGPPAELEAQRISYLVHRVLEDLPTDRDRTVLMRFYLREHEKADICRELQLSELAFNQVLFRARNRFRKLLADAGITKNDLLGSEGLS